VSPQVASVESVASETKFDSRPDTFEHIHQVQRLLHLVATDLHRRGLDHDRSKLVSPEVEYFDKFTPRLKLTTYNSPEYKADLAAMQPALDHHYAANDHHPEHFPHGMREMNLIQMIELCCDWIAASRRQNNGCPIKSCDKNQERYGYSDETKQMLKLTVNMILLLEKSG